MELTGWVFHNRQRACPLEALTQNIAAPKRKKPETSLLLPRWLTMESNSTILFSNIVNKLTMLSLLWMFYIKCQFPQTLGRDLVLNSLVNATNMVEKLAVLRDLLKDIC